jgi:hypothetical protein
VALKNCINNIEESCKDKTSIHKLLQKGGKKQGYEWKMKKK